jgi:hypothetical protein
MNVRSLPLLLFAAGISLPAHAQHVASIQNSNAAVQQTSLEPGQDPDERICRVTPPPLGSRLGATRTCATRAQWHEMDIRRAAARQTLEIAQSQRPCTGEGGGGGATCR